VTNIFVQSKIQSLSKTVTDFYIVKNPDWHFMCVIYSLSSFNRRSYHKSNLKKKEGRYVTQRIYVHSAQCGRLPTAQADRIDKNVLNREM
jgi:hypothetical protein